MQHDREHPWHIRRVTHRHLHDQRNLVDLHLLTQAWGCEGIANPFDQEPSLEDDTWPEDVLLRLEHQIRALQLQAIGARRTESLDELSYQAGQESASRRWTQSDPTEGSIAPADKRALLLALYHSPLSGRLGPAAFLIRRTLITEVSVELLNCPHRQAEASRAAGAGLSTPAEAVDALCLQQFHWLRGHFNYLNPAITLSASRPGGRCVVSW